MKLFNWKNSSVANLTSDFNDVSAELIFISYAREDRDFALRLNDSLKELDRAAWLDINIPHTAEWKREIDEKINEATAVVFIISPHSTVSESFCLIELEIATNHEKRIIPILYEDVNYATVDLRLAKKQWINFTVEEDFDKSVVDLISALNADLDYLKQHTYLGLEQTDWVRSGQDSNLLLKGKRLLEAERWLQNVKKDFEPRPSQSHIEYINASRRYANNRKKLSWALAVAVLFSLIGVSVLAKNLFDNRKISQANRLADKSLMFLDDDPEMSLSLAYKAVETFPTEKAEQSLRQSLIKAPGRLVLKGHEKPLTDAAFSPDDRRIVTTSLDNTLRVWDPNTGEEVKIFRLPNSVQSLSFNSKDSNQILTVDDSGFAKLLNVENGNTLDLRDSQCSVFFKAAFSNDGNYIVAAGEKAVCLWKKDSAGFSKSQTSLISDKKAVFKSFDISPNSKYIALVLNNNEFQINKLADFSLVTKKIISSGGLNDIVFSRDGSLLLVSGDADNLGIWKNEVLTGIWDTKNWTRNDAVPNPTNFISRRSFNLNLDRLIIPWYRDSSLIFENIPMFIKSGGEVEKRWTATRSNGSLDGHIGSVKKAFYSINNDIITVGTDLVVGVWQPPIGGQNANPTKMLKLRGHTKEINGVSFNSNESKIVSFGNDTTARVWDLADTNKSKTQTGVSQQTYGGFTSINFSPDGNYAVVGSVGGGATVWNLSSNEWGGSPVKSFMNEPTIHNAVLSPDNNWILTAEDGGTAKIYEWRTERKNAQTMVGPVKEFSIKEQYEKKNEEAFKESYLEFLRGIPKVLDAKFSPDGRKVVIASSFATQIWDVNTETKLNNLHGEEGSAIVLFHPDGKRIISDLRTNALKADSGRTKNLGMIVISDAETGKRISELKGHMNSIKDLKISPDGNFLASASADGTVRVWNLVNYETVSIIKIFEDDGVTKWNEFENVNENASHAARRIAFSPDSKLLATANEDGSAKIWMAATGKLINHFAGHTEAATDINFNSDGKLVVTSSLDTTAKIWNTETGALLFTLDDSKRELNRAAFSPNGKYVITIGKEDYVQMYKRENFAPLEELRQMARERIMLEHSDDELTKNILNTQQ